MEPDLTNPHGTSRKSKSEIWKEFYENSTLHGLHNAFASKSLVTRLLWLSFMLVAFGYLVFSAVISVTRFMQHPTLLKVRERMNDTLPFPSVTICTQNFADRKKIFAKDNDSDFLKYNLNISACAATESIRAGKPCGHALACAFIQLNVLQGQLFDECTYEYRQNITYALNTSKVEFDLLEFFHTFAESLEEIIRSCTIGGNPCSYTKFEPRMARERLCHSFNSKMLNGKREYYSFIAGSMGGLSILLKHRADRYFYPKYTEGFEVFINEPGMARRVTGIQIPPGTSTMISMTREQIEYIESPYGSSCQNLHLKGYKTYSQFGCYDECASDYVNKTCGCRIAGLGEHNDSLACYSKDGKCLKNIDFSYNSCNCPVACSMVFYRKSVSSNALPRSSIPGVQAMFGSDYSDKDFSHISIFYENHIDVVLEEKFTFGVTSLLGEIGGNMGLLLGCSVLTLIEFVFLFFSLACSSSSRVV